MESPNLGAGLYCVASPPYLTRHDPRDEAAIRGTLFAKYLQGEMYINDGQMTGQRMQGVVVKSNGQKIYPQ
jgi:hypothetical protein